MVATPDRRGALVPGVPRPCETGRTYYRFAVVEQVTKPHYLRGGVATWSPDVVVSFDTETTEIPEDDRLRNVIACWDAVVHLRHGKHPTLPRYRLAAGTEPAQLCDLVVELSEIDREVWAYAHNLNFDLTVTRLPAVLAARGFEVKGYGMAKDSNWWVLTRGRHKVIVTDSWSWLPMSLEAAAKHIGRRKIPLPGTGATLDEWHRRCKHDAAILDELLATLMDWWDQENLGRWSITGAACGWQAMRAKTGANKIVVGPDQPRTAFERSAVYSGRKEVYVVGELHGEWIADYDFVAAYPTVAAHYRLPTHPGRPFRELPAGIVPGSDTSRDVIAECVVTADRPCVPCRVDHEVWWPVGRFQTVLTGPEIAFATGQGAHVEIGRGYEYRQTHNLRPWAVWVLALLATNVEQAPSIVRLMAKGWSRSVIGKFAAHSSQVTSVRPSSVPDWHLETGHNLDTGRPLEVLTIGGSEITTEHDLDAIDCSPAMLSFVESWCRVGLGRMMATRHPSRLVQCNTDGWVERRAVRSAAYELPDVPPPFRAIRKACTNEIVILGPDHLQTPVERRLAGIPRDARPDGAGTWRWHDWPSLRWQIEHADAGEYERPCSKMILQPSYARRWVLDDGETVPVTMNIGTNGENVIATWQETQGRRNSDVLAPYQDERLQALREAGPPVPVIFEGAGPRLPGRFLIFPRSR